MVSGDWADGARALLALGFLGLLVVAAISDFVTYRIPNWISLTLAAFFPLQALLSGMDWTEAGIHLALGAAFLAVGLVLQVLRLFGGGDVKLLAVSALWLGWPKILLFMMVMALAGGVLAVALLAMRKILARQGALRSWLILSPKAGVPYGAAMAAAGLWMYFRA